MPRPSLIERYFAQCQAHRSPPLPVFVASFRDGVVDANLADISLADIRLFALAVTDTASVAAAGGGGGPRAGAGTAAAAASRERRRGESGGGSAASDVSSAASAHGQAATFFSKLHFGYDPASAARRHQQHTGAARGGASAAPPPLLAPQSESTLRCLIEAVAQLVKENASTLRSFAWCGLPIIPPGRGPRGSGGLGARANAATLTQLLPLCTHLTTLRIEGVALSRAQFMQLTMISLSGSSTDVDGGSWLALEEASFAGCDLTDSCKGGIVRLIRAGVPMKSAEQWRRSVRGSSAGNSSGDPTPVPSPATTISGAVSRTRGLRRLDLSDNPLGDETARAIATAITGAALHTLRLANTAVTSRGAALLLLPAVLEENAVELVDLSNTEVSSTYGTAAATSTSSAAELRLLAASSITAGFRVVARGMGQLLVLREAVRTPQQPWNVRTSFASSTGGIATAGESPMLAPPRAAQRASASRAGDSGRSRLRSTGRSGSQQAREEEDAAADAEPDPFSAFIQTRPAPMAPQPARTPSSPLKQPSTAAPTDSPSSTPAATAAAATAAGVGPAPSSPPPLPASTAAPPAGGAPWWPQWGSWGPLLPPQASSAGGGREWVPVPVAVPIPIFTPLPLPYAAGASPQPQAQMNASAWPGVPFFSPSAIPPAGEAAATAAATTAAAVGTVSPPAVPKAATTASTPAEAPDSSFLHVVSSAPTGSDAGMQGAAEREEAAAVPVVEDALMNVATSSADDAASSQLTREASVTAGGSKFLTALIARLEAHETDVSERMEQQYQRTTSQLTAIEKDMRFRLQQIAETGRKEGAAAAERQAALLDAIAGLREPPARSAAEAMSEEMLTQLVHLIEVGMTRVQAVLAKGGAEEKEDKRRAAAAVTTGSTTRASPTAAPLSERDMVTETNQRLKQLGW